MKYWEYWIFVYNKFNGNILINIENIENIEIIAYMQSNEHDSFVNNAILKILNYWIHEAIEWWYICGRHW